MKINESYYLYICSYTQHLHGAYFLFTSPLPSTIPRRIYLVETLEDLSVSLSLSSFKAYFPGTMITE